MIINLNLEGKKIIVVGGGNEAEKRIKSILNEKCEIIVISDSVNTQISKLVKTKKIKFKKQFGARLWVTSYCNDVMAYIPTLRVLTEGGYEGQSSMAVYGLPADRWKPNVEDLVSDAAKALVQDVSRAK